MIVNKAIFQLKEDESIISKRRKSFFVAWFYE